MKAKIAPPREILLQYFCYTENSWVNDGHVHRGGLLWRTDTSRNIHYKILRRIEEQGLPFAGGITSNKKSGVKYSIINVPGFGYYLTHRLVWIVENGGDLTADDVVDHINLDTFDNRISNLRLCSTRENHFNRSSYRGSSSSYVGVHFRSDSKSKPWCASYRKCGKAVKIGYFATELEAAIARDAVVSEEYGPYANLNLPASSHD